jgi:hypothetical protein
VAQSKLNFVRSFRVVHVCKEGNAVTNCLPRFARNVNESQAWLESVSPFQHYFLLVYILYRSTRLLVHYITCPVHLFVTYTSCRTLSLLILHSHLCLYKGSQIHRAILLSLNLSLPSLSLNTVSEPPSCGFH